MSEMDAKESNGRNMKIDDIDQKENELGIMKTCNNISMRFSHTIDRMFYG